MGRGGVGAPGQGYDAGSLLVFATSAAPVDARALAAPFLALERAGVLLHRPSVLVGQRHPLGPSETQRAAGPPPLAAPTPPTPLPPPPAASANPGG